MLVDFDVRAQQEIDFFTGGSVIMDYRFIFWPESNSLQLKCLDDGSFSLHIVLSGGLESLLVDYCDVLSAICIIYSIIWTLILTAPIHCRGSIGEQVM